MSREHNQFFCADIQRRNFGVLLLPELYSSLNLISTAEMVPPYPPPTDHVMAVWSQDPRENGQLPQALICTDDAEVDWSAWITTYAARLRPFSSFSRLLSYKDCQKYSRWARTPSLGPLTWPVAGLVLGELLGALKLDDRNLEVVSAASCASTLSFVLFRAAAMYEGFDAWPGLVDAWEKARRFTRQRGRNLDARLVARVCSIIMRAAGIESIEHPRIRGDLVVSDACHEMLFEPKRVPSALSAFPFFSQAERMTHGSREESVVALERFVREIDRTEAEDEMLFSFMLGYLTSRIAPGTLRHSTMLSSITPRFPAAIMWYGFCAGFGGNKSDGAERKGIDLPSSARRVLRDLLRPEPLSSAPNCDISLTELAALSQGGGDPLENLITLTQGAAIVELVPSVWTTINTSPRTADVVVRRGAIERESLLAIRREIEKLRSMYEELLVENLEDSEEQPNLFPRRKRRV